MGGRSCGENDPQKLEEHHPDKENYPNHTVVLCANCHSKITRKNLSERRKAQQEMTMPKSVEVSPIETRSPAFSAQPNANTMNPVYSSHVPLLTPAEGAQLARWILYGLGGILAGEATCDKGLSWWERLVLFGLAGLFLWTGKQAKTQDPGL